MAEVSRDEVIAVLRRENPKARSDELAMYADSYRAYHEANANIEKNGTIVAHPRTGAPIANPYLVVRQQAMAELRKFTRIKNTGGLWS